MDLLNTACSFLSVKRERRKRNAISWLSGAPIVPSLCLPIRGLWYPQLFSPSWVIKPHHHVWQQPVFSPIQGHLTMLHISSLKQHDAQPEVMPFLGLECPCLWPSSGLPPPSDKPSGAEREDHRAQEPWGDIFNDQASKLSLRQWGRIGYNPLKLIDVHRSYYSKPGHTSKLI